MTLQQLKTDLSSLEDIHQLNKYLEIHYKAIELFFYGQKTDELARINEKIEDAFYTFINTPPLQQIESGQIEPSNPIKGILILFATIFEKINLTAPISQVISLLPNSSIKFRLKAQQAYKVSISNAKKDYLRRLPKILKSLHKAQDINGQEYTNEVAQEIITYYRTVKLELGNRKLDTELQKIKNTLQQNQPEFPFLLHPAIRKFIFGVQFEELIIDQTAQKIYEPSLFMYSFFQESIVTKIKQHPLTTQNRLLGYSNDIIRSEIIKYGRANFNQPYQNLSLEDKTMLYCYFNMRKHYFTSRFVFDKINNFHQWFPQNNPTIFIDLGCGPLTSALGLADYYSIKTNTPLKFNYIGIDISTSMLAKANEFSQIDYFNPDSQFTFIQDWNDLPKLLPSLVEIDTKIIFNASYLFASDSLEVANLANVINKVTGLYPNNQILFIFQNPNNPNRNRKYTLFKSQLKQLFEKPSGVETVYYKNKPNSFYEPSSEIVYYELLSNSLN